jgi:short-subunit dehydrogenase
MDSLAAFRERYGPWALVAGGSEGLGLAFAESLTARGFNLVLIARRLEKLEAVAARLRAAHPVEVRALALDLGAPNLASAIAEPTHDLDIGLVVANAAEVRIERFLYTPLEAELRAVDVNCRATLVLAHQFGRRLRARGRGGIIVMSSLAGVYGGPYVATYAATKAFGCLLAESLAGELRPDGVDVVASVAGPTRTPGYTRQASSRLMPMDPARVVEETLQGLGRTPRVVPGATNKMTSRLMSILPRRWVIPLVAAQTRKLL